MTPVKMTSSERRTATQLSSPPTTAASAARQHHAQQHGQPDLVAQDGRPVAADAGERADAEEQLPGAAEDHVERDGVRREHQPVDGDAHHRAGLAVAQRDQGEQPT